MTGTGGDQLARQDMFATQVNDWKNETRIGNTPIGDRSAFDVRNPLEEQIAEIQKVTKENPALRSGTPTDAICRSKHLHRDALS